MKVFVAGPRAIKVLDPIVQNRIMRILDKKMTILVGDANGVDRLVQEYALKHSYTDVMVYASNGKTRNNLGNWPVVSINAGKRTGFAFYAMKDVAMANESDYGLMIWNGESKGTLNNIINLAKQGKTAVVYLIPHKKFFSIKNMESVQMLVNACGASTVTLFKSLADTSGTTATHLNFKQESFIT